MIEESKKPETAEKADEYEVNETPPPSSTWHPYRWNIIQVAMELGDKSWVTETDGHTTRHYLPAHIVASFLAFIEYEVRLAYDCGRADGAAEVKAKWDREEQLRKDMLATPLPRKRRKPAGRRVSRAELAAFRATVDGQASRRKLLAAEAKGLWTWPQAKPEPASESRARRVAPCTFRGG